MVVAVAVGAGGNAPTPSVVFSAVGFSRDICVFPVGGKKGRMGFLSTLS